MKKIILALCLVFGVCFADKTEELEELFDKCHTYDDRNSCFELAGIILKALNIYPDKKKWSFCVTVYFITRMRY